MSLKVLHYWPRSLAIGGVEKHIECLVSALVKIGCDARIVTSVEEIPSSGNVILHTHAQDSVQKKDVLHVHTLHGTSVGRALACREFYSLSAAKASLRERQAVKRAHGLICVSKDVEREAKRYFFPTSSKKTVVISGGVTDDFLSQKALWVASNPQDVYVLFVGRGSDFVKNARLVKRAWKGKASMPRLVAVPGDGFENEVNLIKENLLHLTGPLTSLEVSQLMAKSACLLAPSFYESDGLIFWEAMAIGIPIITNFKLTRRLRNYGYDAAFGVDPRDPEGLQRAVMNCVKYEPRANPLVRTWDEVAKEVLGFYQSLLVL